MEPVHRAGAAADDTEQRRSLPNRIGQIAGVAGRALLLEQRRAVRRPCFRHLRHRSLAKHRAAKT
jgi:hypothetical protein